VTADPGSPNPTLSTAVRFGNVLGSRGSVVPTFARQIELGGPVTVTHPDMTRYFIDVSEAATLIIQAAGLTEGNDTFMLEMGQRIKVDDLARKMIRMRGLRPDVDIQIAYTGIRPGEKLHEELTHAEDDVAVTRHPAIYRVKSRSTDRSRIVSTGIERLLSLAAQGFREELVRELMELCHDQAPKFPVLDFRSLDDATQTQSIAATHFD
jgi:FlaA1/EpsC-like NDP-sugar epimerase